MNSFLPGLSAPVTNAMNLKMKNLKPIPTSIKWKKSIYELSELEKNKLSKNHKMARYIMISHSLEACEDWQNYSSTNILTVPTDSFAARMIEVLVESTGLVGAHDAINFWLVIYQEMFPRSKKFVEEYTNKYGVPLANFAINDIHLDEALDEEIENNNELADCLYTNSLRLDVFLSLAAHTYENRYRN